jgi:protein SCO1/2
MPPKGEVMLVYFGYTSCPDVCPTTLSDVRRALRGLGEDRAGRVALTFITVDPERDTASVLDGYVSSFVTPNHVVRIDDPAALREVQRPFGARSELGPKHDDGTYEVAHTGVLYAVNDEGKVAVEWPFGTDSDTIAHDLGILLGATGS